MEQFIIVPGINGNELIRNMAMHGQNSFGIRIMGGTELARTALMRAGMPVEGDILSFRDETEIVAAVAEGHKSYADIIALTRAIRTLRYLVTGDDEEQEIRTALEGAIFKEKNEKILKVLHDHLDELRKRDSLDQVSLIRMAAAKCLPMDVSFAVLAEYPLRPLEQRLLDVLSGGRYETRSIFDLYGVTYDRDAGINIRDIRNCYGANNEVEAVLDDIYSGKRLDSCTVCCADPATYSQLFFDKMTEHDIPMTFGCGIPITNSYPAALLKDYLNWRDSFFSPAALAVLLRSDGFDHDRREEMFGDADRKELFAALSSIRLTNDAQINAARAEAVPIVARVGAELALPIGEFIRKYARVRDYKVTEADRMVSALDKAAVGIICNALNGDPVIPQDDMIEDILGRRILAGRSEPGKLFITDMRNTVTAIRKDLYITGLSALNFPGCPTEDHLLLDDDLEQFGECAGRFTSEQIVTDRKEQLKTVAALASALGTDIHLSFAGENVSELKKNNASSVIFELSGRTDYDRIGYFEPRISKARLIGDSYNEGIKKGREGDLPRIFPEDRTQLLNRSYSPSMIAVFFDCPYKFLLKSVYNIREHQTGDDSDIFPANERGTLAHKIMEEHIDEGLDRAAFLRISLEMFDGFMKTHPPIVGNDVGRVRVGFLEMMGHAYDNHSGNPSTVREQRFAARHETGIMLSGFPDRVEDIGDGDHMVVDYKTGRTVKHTDNDIDSCLQAVIYANILEANGIPVSCAEFRYINGGPVVRCRYDDEMKLRLRGKLEEFKNGLTAGTFEKVTGGQSEEKICAFCGYRDICKGDRIGG